MPVCEKCKSELEIITETEFGDPVDINTPWEQYLCTECYNKIWDGLLNNACGMCRTEPCKKGRDCWVNPWPQIMYLCYVAPRKIKISEDGIIYEGLKDGIDFNVEMRGIK